MLRLTLPALAALLLSSAAHAADWALDADASTLTFTGSLSGADVNGEFESFTADITLDPQALDDASVEITIDIASVTTDNPTANGALTGSAWFNAGQFGTASFVSDAVTQTDAGYLAAGTLTIRDQTMEIELPFTLDVDGDTAKAMGEIVLDRTNFGIGDGAFAQPQPVAHEVTVTFDLTASRS